MMTVGQINECLSAVHGETGWRCPRESAVSEGWSPQYSPGSKVWVKILVKAREEGGTDDRTTNCQD